MQLCIFEDTDCMNFEPLAYSRPVFDLVCGINTLKEKILRDFPKIKYNLLCRSYIAPVVKQQNPGVNVNLLSDDSYLFINGSVISSNELRKKIPLKNKNDIVYKSGDKVIAAFITGETYSKIKTLITGTLDGSVFDGMPVKELKIKHASYIWDLINANGEGIKNDFNYISAENKGKKKLTGKLCEGVHLVARKNIIIESGAEIKHGAVIDASGGPVYIAKNSVVYHNAVIIGPAFIGPNSQVKSGAYIHDNVSICGTCKIGGEVEDTVFLPFSNKQHSGFIGHAYIGSWVNLGADTNCSDLKNNYGMITAYVNGKSVNTGSQFLGLIMGDHSKSAINTMFNTGTNVGFSSNIFSSGFPEKFIPSFSWTGDNNSQVYKLNKALDTAKKVMGRRNKQMSEEEEKLFTYIFEMTKDERRIREYPD